MSIRIWLESTMPIIRGDETFKILGFMLLIVVSLMFIVNLYISPLWYIKIYHPNFFNRNRNMCANLFGIYTLCIVYALFGYLAALYLSGFIIVCMSIVMISIHFGIVL